MASKAEGLASMCRAEARAPDLLVSHFSASSLEVLPDAMVPQPLPQMQMAAGTPAVRNWIVCCALPLDQSGSTHAVVGQRLEAATDVW